MSTSDNKTRHRLTIKVTDGLSAFTLITVFDGNNNVMPFEKVGNAYAYELLRGLYTVRADINREIADTVIRLTGDVCYYAGDDAGGRDCKQLKLPALYSSALIRFPGDSKRYTSTYEYYTGPAQFYSHQETVTREGPKPDSCLFIFMRFASQGHFKKWSDLQEDPFWDQYRLTDDKGRVLYDFKPAKILVDGIVESEPVGSEIVADMHSGYWAFNAYLPKGMYFLIYDGKQGRQMPLYVYDDWHTQLFITLNDDGTPSFGSARLFLAQVRNFDSLNEDNKYIDVFLDKLQNRDYSLSRELIEYAARSKFQSPMLGLLCAYLYLSGKDNNFDNVLSLMTENLREKILRGGGDSPDLVALRILEDIHLKVEGDYSELPPVKGTPMFRLGYDAIRRAAIKFPHLIPEYSLNDYIAEQLYCDCPYNTFGIITAVEAYSERPDTTTFDTIETAWSPGFNAPFEKFGPERLDDIEGLEINEIKDSLAEDDEITINIPGEISFDFPLEQGSRTWATEAIKNFIASRANINPAEIAARFHLPLNTVKRVMGELSKRKLRRPTPGFNWKQAPGRESDFNMEQTDF